MYCSGIENIISYHKRTMVKSINWLTKKSSEGIWHTALILSGGGRILILYGHMIKIYCQNNTVFSATFSIEFTQPAAKLAKFDRPRISYRPTYKEKQRGQNIGYIFTSAENASLDVSSKT